MLGLVGEANKLPGVRRRARPVHHRALSPDGRYALITVQFADRADKVTDEQRAAYEADGAAAQRAGLRVEHGGEVMNAEPEVGGNEGIGVVIALVVLLVTFGSLVAAGMTMLNALLGVGAGMAGLFALSGVVQLTSTAPVLALMLGLAVGIDYSLFITSRHRQHLVEGLAPDEAAGRAVGTAGSAVVFAGATVVIALAGLAVVNIPFLTVMGLAAAGTVAVAVLVAITLQPALLAFAGTRILSRASAGRSPTAAAAHHTEGFGFRWARLDHPAAGAGDPGRRARPRRAGDPGRAHAHRAARGERRARRHPRPQGRRPGRAGLRPRLQRPPRAGRVHRLRRAPRRRRPRGDRRRCRAPRTCSPPPRRTSAATAGPRCWRSSRRPARPTPPPRPRARRARQGSSTIEGADFAVTGQTAVGIDVSEKLSDAMPEYLLLVVGLSVLLLMLVFRSILVPLKAAAGFLLTVGATFGITVLVFQDGHLGRPRRAGPAGPLVSFLPILLIGILFGLAMDYEVFLVSRMREDFVHGGRRGRRRSAAWATAPGWSPRRRSS